jgi:hypothetical protein
VKALERRVLVVGVDRAMLDLLILEILDKVGRKEALPDAAFAVDDDVELFGIIVGQTFWIGDPRSASAGTGLWLGRFRVSSRRRLTSLRLRS